MTTHCVNCGRGGAETYEVLVRGEESTEAAVCEDCRVAILEAVTAGRTE